MNNKQKFKKNLAIGPVTYYIIKQARKQFSKICPIKTIDKKLNNRLIMNPLCLNNQF